jgi:hypothetical protein
MSCRHLTSHPLPGANPLSPRDTVLSLPPRYATKHDYLEVHKKSPQFLEFRQKLTDMSATYTMVRS